MPRVFRNQPKQATGRLGAGQSAQIVVNAHNVNSRTIYRLQHRYNTSNSTNDRPRSGRPRVTTPRQGRFILSQHLLDRFTTTDTARHTTGTQQRPISHSVPTPSVAAWPPTISIVYVLLEVLFLQTVTDMNDCYAPQLINNGAISNGIETSSQMKVGSVFRRRMSEYGSGEQEVNVMRIHV